MAKQTAAQQAEKKAAREKNKAAKDAEKKAAREKKKADTKMQVDAILERVLAAITPKPIGTTAGGARSGGEAMVDYKALGEVWVNGIETKNVGIWISKRKNDVDSNFEARFDAKVVEVDAKSGHSIVERGSEEFNRMRRHTVSKWYSSVVVSLV